MVIHGKDKIVLHKKMQKNHFGISKSNLLVEQAEIQSFIKTLCELTYNIRTAIFFSAVGILTNNSSQAKVFVDLSYSNICTCSTSYSQKHYLQHGIHCFTCVSFAINLVNRYKITD